MNDTAKVRLRMTVSQKAKDLLVRFADQDDRTQGKTLERLLVEEEARRNRQEETNGD